MLTYWFRRWRAPLEWLAMVVFVLAAGAYARAQEFQGDDPEGSPVDVFVREGDVEKTDKRANYWIGIVLTPVSDVLRAQLNLADDQGIVIGNVAPDSPAAKAGLKKYDVLIKAAGEPVGGLEDIKTALVGSRGTEVSLDVLRGGTPMSVTVTPVKRKQPFRVKQFNFNKPDIDQLRAWVEKLENDGSSRSALKLLGIGPDVLIGYGDRTAPFPEDLSVSIEKNGSAPAKISVQMDDKSWTLTEDDLGELPGEVRPFVERMVGRGAMMMFKKGPLPKTALKLRLFESNQDKSDRTNKKQSFQKQLRQLDKQLRLLTEQMEKLREQLDENSD